MSMLINTMIHLTDEELATAVFGAAYTDQDLLFARGVRMGILFSRRGGEFRRQEAQAYRSCFKMEKGPNWEPGGEEQLMSRIKRLGSRMLYEGAKEELYQRLYGTSPSAAVKLDDHGLWGLFDRGFDPLPPDGGIKRGELFCIMSRGLRGGKSTAFAALLNQAVKRLLKEEEPTIAHSTDSESGRYSEYHLYPHQLEILERLRTSGVVGVATTTKQGDLVEISPTGRMIKRENQFGSFETCKITPASFAPPVGAVPERAAPWGKKKRFKHGGPPQHQGKKGFRK